MTNDTLFKFQELMRKMEIMEEGRKHASLSGDAEKGSQIALEEMEVLKSLLQLPEVTEEIKSRRVMWSWMINDLKRQYGVN